MTDPRLERPEWRGRTNLDALTIAVIEHAEALVRRVAPDIAHPFSVTKGSYQPDDSNTTSAGTHSRGGAADLVACGHRACYWALRAAGAAAWLREATPSWRPHFHLIVVDHPALSPSAARQVVAYRGRRNGLKDNGPDTGPRLDPIPRPVWPYPKEDDMTPEQLDQLADKIVDKIMREPRTVKRPDGGRRKLNLGQMLDEVWQRLARLTNERESTE